jgi:hypothetical protein
MRTSGGGAAGKAGGSGIVVVKEASFDKNVAPGVWDMNSVYDFVKANNWVS